MLLSLFQCSLKTILRRVAGFTLPAAPRPVYCPLPPLDWHAYEIPTFKRRGIRLSIAPETARP